MAKILIVDDSIIMRKNLKTILIQAGHEIVGEASNGVQAYSEYERFLPDVVTMDITMPVLDGIGAVRKITADYPDARIIIISALDQKSMVFEALESGAKHYIIKPITPEKVITVVEEVMSYNRLEDYSRELKSKHEALGHMWIEIKESKDEIMDLSKTVDQRVSERTGELEETNKELKMALDKLKETQEQLIKSEKAAGLTGIVVGIAHEINTPVGIGITAVSYLQERTRELMKLYKENKMKRSDLEKYLENSLETTESVLVNLKRASELIRDFKQVAADQSAEEKSTINVRSYVDKVLSSMIPGIGKRDIDVKINCDGNLIIESYPLVLLRILCNLLENSLLHGFEGCDGGSISINITTVDQKLYIEYSDDGNGIDKDIQGKIFDPFFTTKRGEGHTGLGLNVVYNLVTQTLKGSIKCESEKRCGAAFIIIFPI